MAERFGELVIYTADDEIPDCLNCDNCDKDLDCSRYCGAEHGWVCYRRTEMESESNAE